MQRALRWFGMVAGLGLGACQGNVPQSEQGEPLRAPIIGGERDTVSRGVVGILTREALCTGSLLAPNLVLTARHCVSDPGGEMIDCSNTFGPNYDPGDFAVTTDSDLTANGVTPTFGVREVRTPTPRGVCGNDIAVMILAENIPASTATPLEPRLDDRPMADESFDAVGYGIQAADDELGVTSGVRMRANGNAVFCVGATACRGSDATNAEWVAEVPVCSGDSGGPALDSDGRVIGVASRANVDCSAALYAAVDSWKSLIVEAALAAADAGDYAPPDWAGGTPPDAGADAGMPADSGTPDSGLGMGASTSGGSAGTSGASGTGSAGPNGGAGLNGGAGPNGGGAGTTSAGRAGTPGDDPLGEPCTTSCPNGYLCYAEDQAPPGICVPSCFSADADCPTGYACNTRLGACTPEDDDSRSREKDDAGCGCRTVSATSSADSAWGILALAGIFAGRLRRRRRPAR